LKNRFNVKIRTNFIETMLFTRRSRVCQNAGLPLSKWRSGYTETLFIAPALHASS
jgi:hypothetical protein